MLTQSLSQLMGAVVCVQTGGLTESIKGFYKLRKAYIALDGILQMEQRYLKAQTAASTVASSSVSSESVSQADARPDTPGGKRPLSSKGGAPGSPPMTRAQSPLSSFKLSHNEEEAPVKQTDRHDDQPFSRDGSDEDSMQKITGRLPGLSVSTGDLRSQNLAPSSAPILEMENMHVNLGNDPDSNVFSHPIDAYIHSGANLCFGVLLLIISMVPPTFSKLLSIIGFRGDKELGLRMLWQASKFHNVNGAMAALGVLVYYNAFVRFCDIVSDRTGEDDDVEGYPMARLSSLLSDMRSRFPKSQLWLLEESRMHSANKRLDKGLELLSGENRSPLKQVEMLHVFEKSLDAMYIHNYELCAESFLKVRLLTF